MLRLYVIMHELTVNGIDTFLYAVEDDELSVINKYEYYDEKY